MQETAAYQTGSLTHKVVSKLTNIGIFQKAMWWLLWLSCALEMLIFPSWDNVVGCLVSLASTWLYFRYVMQIEVIRRHPASFVAFSALFLFMYLPLPATLLDGQSMSHDFYNPILTYLLQLLYYVLTLLAFQLGSRWSMRHTWLFRTLRYFGYFASPTTTQLWVLGVVGWIFRLFLMSAQGGGEAVAGKGSISLFAMFVYAPICIAFKHLYGQPKATKREQYIVFAYIALSAILFISSNSRSKMLSPIIIYLGGYVLSKVYEHTDKIWLSARKLALLAIGVLVVAGPLSDMAYAMVIVRSERSDMSFTRLLERSFEVFMDKDQIAMARRAGELTATSNKLTGGTTQFDWNERYVSNIFMERLSNYRVVDASIYHAGRVGYANPWMTDEFLTRLKIMFPGPIVRLLFGKIDKQKYSYSTQDLLYQLSVGSRSLGHFRVGGDVGLGLATFGYFYFVLVFFTYAIIFFIFNSLSRYVRGHATIPFFIILDIYYTYFLTFTVAGGITKHITYVLWGFFFHTFWLLLTYKVVRWVVRR